MGAKDKNKVIIDLNPLKSNRLNFISVIAYFMDKYKHELQEELRNPVLINKTNNIVTGKIEYSLHKKAVDIIESCITISKEESFPEDFYMYHLDEVATELKALFPKGKKISSVLWTDSVPLIKKRLQLFNNKYPGYYSKEQVIQATKRYVDSFNGVHTHMRALKYFIFKNDVKGGEVEQTSDLLNYLEDDSTEIMNNNDWTAELV